MKTVFRWLLTLVMLAAGVGHFLKSDDFIAMVPPWLPAAPLLVYVSGVAEIAGAIGLQIRPLRKAAAWGLVALYIAVFPANVHMAVHHLSPAGTHMPDWALWARLPVQVVLVAWAWWFTREE